ncbi:MAG: DUF1192 domain-containing protein [Xanthobacteraceae bacterium]|nr:DUF1192 domain-containing protein [Xanthobacteraceae bacterium]
MPTDDDDMPRPKIAHQIGQDLSMLSVDELAQRVRLLRDEITRVENEMTKKRASRDAAANFFKS